jgi:hypothetical protein
MVVLVSMTYRDVLTSEKRDLSMETAISMINGKGWSGECGIMYTRVFVIFPVEGW